MIGVRDVRLTVDRLLAREQRGSTISPSDFNRFLSIANQREYSDVAKVLEINSDVIDSVFNLFKEAYIMPTSGVVTLPEDCYKVLSVMVNGKVVDRVSYLEYSEIKENVITTPSATQPVFYVREGKIVIDPVFSVVARIGYLRKMNEPYLDYYVNTQKNIVYLDEGEQVSSSLIDNDFLNYGNDGQPIEIVGGLYTSKTVEFEWVKDENRINVLNTVLTLCGISASVNYTITGSGQ